MVKRDGPVEEDSYSRSILAYVASLQAEDSVSVDPESNRPGQIFMAGYSVVCAVSLFGGAIAGSRAFESSPAFEALDKLERALAELKPRICHTSSHRCSDPLLQDRPPPQRRKRCGWQRGRSA